MVLVVTSKVRAWAKSEFEVSLSKDVPEALTVALEKALDKAKEAAVKDKVKTLKGRHVGGEASTNPSLVVVSKVKAKMKEEGFSVGSDSLPYLTKVVEDVLRKAAEATKASKKKTVKASSVLEAMSSSDETE